MAVFELDMSSTDMINNGTISDDEEVASDVPRRRKEKEKKKMKKKKKTKKKEENKKKKPLSLVVVVVVFASYGTNNRVCDRHSLTSDRARQFYRVLWSKPSV